MKPCAFELIPTPDTKSTVPEFLTTWIRRQANPDQGT